jgi:hypothetical protein
MRLERNMIFLSFYEIYSILKNVSNYYLGDHMKEEEMDGSWSTYPRRFESSATLLLDPCTDRLHTEIHQCLLSRFTDGTFGQCHHDHLFHALHANVC